MDPLHSDNLNSRKVLAPYGYQATVCHLIGGAGNGEERLIKTHRLFGSQTQLGAC